MTFLFSLISVQALLGAFDNLWHHEITERLPAKRGAVRETALHSVRQFLYAYLFIALAWFEWHGAWAALVAAVLVAEIAVTLADFVVEDRTRKLPALERVLHTVLAVLFGVIIAVLAPVLMAWWQQPTAVTAVFYGAFSWLFTVFGAGVFAWSVRNAIAVIRHRRPQEWVRDPITVGARVAPRTVLVTGATGFIGGHLVRRLVARGDMVIVLTRDADKAVERFGPHAYVVTDLKAIRRNTRIDAIVNLAGAPILGWPWTKARREQLLASRVAITQSLVTFCARLTHPPRVVVSASAIGYYGVRGDELLDEKCGPQSIFQSRLCQVWEDAARELEGHETRVVRLRIGLVLGRDGGALPQLARPVRFAAGAVLGSGRQWVSWIHVEDLLSLIEHALDTPDFRGAYNAVAPEPVRHADMQRMLARTLCRPLWLRVPASVLRVALGEMAQLLVDGQRVVPVRAMAAGFQFRYPRLEPALQNLLDRRARESEARLAEVYYNGNCPVCRTEMANYEKICDNATSGVTFIDSTRHEDALAACGLGREHLERRVYVRDTEGRMLSGLPALIALWSSMPRYRWLAVLFSVPLIHPLAVTIYDQVVAPGLAFWARQRVRAVAGDSGVQAVRKG